MLFKTAGSVPIPTSVPETSAPLTFCLQSDVRRASCMFASVSGSVLPGGSNPGTPLLKRASNLVAEISDADGDTEYFKVHKIIGDGRCMFRATVRSLAMNKGIFLSPSEELDEADKLRVACYDALCRTSHRRREFPDAEKQIRFGYGGDIGAYCKMLARPTFWGGEVEMMVTCSLLRVPIFVYQSEHEVKGEGTGFSIIAKFGEKYGRSNKNHKPRRPVRLLYTGGNHYDLLV